MTNLRRREWNILNLIYLLAMLDDVEVFSTFLINRIHLLATGDHGFKRRKIEGYLLRTAISNIIPLCWASGCIVKVLSHTESFRRADLLLH